MNGNLSSSQFGIKMPSMPSMTQKGAMPIKDNFNGPAPIKQSSFENNMAANSNMPLSKPGFF